MDIQGILTVHRDKRIDIVDHWCIIHLAGSNSGRARSHSEPEKDVSVSSSLALPFFKRKVDGGCAIPERGWLL